MRQHVSNMRATTTDAPRERSGFTLVEMLIAVTLVLLMMTLFAQVFDLASGAMTLQQAISENDQQARTFVTVLRGDLRKRTGRVVTPYMPGETDDAQIVPFADRAGYFYISLNDPANQSDNVLQISVRSTIKADSTDDSPYFGRATTLRGAGTGGAAFLSNSNQPEHDDGQISPNGAAASTGAQVCYFVRAGKLYRRVTLLRDPLPVSGATGPQPMRTDGANPLDYFAPADGLTNGAGEYIKEDGGAGAPGDIWADFDFSVYRANSGSSFLGLDALNNGEVISLGKPRFRFGFDQVTGISREFSHPNPTTGGAFFLGRFTHEETSDARFNFPQTGPNRFSYAGFTPADTDLDGVVDSLNAGPRRGEDLLLSNVHAFEINIWDSRLGAFVPIGHSLTNAAGELGDYHRGRNLQGIAGVTVVPGSGTAWTGSVASWTGRVLDTWSPAFDADNADGDNDDTTGSDPPPYRPLKLYPNLTGFSAPTIDQWAPSTGYTSEDSNGNGVLDAGEDGTGGFPANGRLDGDRVFPFQQSPHSYEMYYECVIPGTSGPASEDANGNGILDAGEDANANSMLDDDEPTWPFVDGQVTPQTIGGRPTWRAVLNIEPLRAIQIRVRFLHVKSNKMRQLTLIHSLID